MASHATAESQTPDLDAVRRVLLVDDSRLQLRIIRGLLEKWGFEVQQAESGREALGMVQEFRPDLIVSDWMMPEMDGIELCQRVQNLKKDYFSYFILLTSKNEKDDIAHGLGVGADDFVSKPVNAVELRARINAGSRIVSMDRQLRDKNRQISETLKDLQDAHEAIDKDLRQARKIQQSLVPERCRVIDGTRISLLLKPCGHVGGDLVGYFEAGPSGLGVYNIDVSGHGITSAMVTARVSGYLSNKFPDQNLALQRTAGPYHAMRPPSETAALLNSRLSADPGVEEYLTMNFATLDLRTGTVRLVQAGHPPALLLKANGTLSFVGEGGLPIGLIEDVSHDTINLKLDPGDRLLFYSDGFTEAMTKSGSMLGEEGLARLMRQCVRTGAKEDLLDDLYWRLTEQMSSPEKMDDDVSAVLIEFQR